jgi:hypothetical protein
VVEPERRWASRIAQAGLVGFTVPHRGRVPMHRLASDDRVALLRLVRCKSLRGAATDARIRPTAGAVRPVRDGAGNAAEAVPERPGATVLRHRGLDLVGRGRRRGPEVQGHGEDRWLAHGVRKAAIQTSGAFQRMQTSFVVSDVDSSR